MFRSRDDHHQARYKSLKTRQNAFFCFVGSHDFLKLFYNKNCEIFLYGNCRDILLTFFVFLKPEE